MGSLLFNLFALLTLVAALGAVLNRNAVNAAMCFMLSLVGVAGLFVLLEAYLLAFVLLLVYAGAVAALFLFIVMLLDTHGRPRPFKRVTLLASVVAAALLATGVLTIHQHASLAPAATSAAAVPSLKDYAYQLFSTYLLPVQIIGFLLLIAMIGVIVLSKKFDGVEETK
ncbi:MAG TPA: NADH-quinone oxidoreductase subunit J [Opitutus sp.]|nr:NADH-quinone oxidoreductase subunit J [Opitutus sp.]